MATYSTRIRPTGNSFHLGFSFTRILSRFRLKRGTLFVAMMFVALIAFEVFNYSTTEFALTDLLSDLKFAGVRWATILALAFCGMDFAGIARLLTPENQRGRSMEAWYLLGAWLLAATMNAMLTWWAVSLALLNHDSLGNEIISREALIKSVPMFVAILVWLIRVLMIGIFTLAGPSLSGEKDKKTTDRSAPIIAGQSSKESTMRRSVISPENNRPIRPAPKSRVIQDT